MSGRILAIGDIHGCDIALENLLLSFKPQSDDIVVLLGDVINRGPNSRRAIEQLLELRSVCELVYVMGNHEEMFLNAVKKGKQKEFWWRNGGAEMAASYGGLVADISEEHLNFIETSVPLWETATEIFVHASFEPGVLAEDQQPEWLRWQRLTGFEQPDVSGKRIICGHTVQKSGQPRILDGWVCLDTGTYIGNDLTGLDVTTEFVYRADQSGRITEPVLLEQKSS